MDFGTKSETHVRLQEAILEVRNVKVMPSKQLHLENVLTALGAKYLLAHVVTKHFTLAMGASTADVDALFTCKNHLQGQHRPSEQQSICWCLAEKSLQLRTYGPELGLPDCGWTTITRPALASRL